MEGGNIFTEIIINAGIAHGFLIAILFRRNKNINSHFFLSLILIDLSLVIFRIKYLVVYMFENMGVRFFITGPFMLLFAPLLYFYLRNIVSPERKISFKDAGHFVLFALYMLIITPLFFFGKDSAYSNVVIKLIETPRIFLLLQFAYYLFLSRGLIQKYKKQIVERFSNVEGMDVSWMNLIVWVLIILLIFIAITAPRLVHHLGFWTYQKSTAVFLSFLCFFIAYKGIQQKKPLEPISGNVNIPDEPDQEMLEKLKEKLLSHMDMNRPHLNPELTLTDLAKQIDLSRNQLSYLINSVIGDNFYNFINKYRVEEVKKLMEKDSQKRYNIIVLAHEAGFNSKSSFNNIFKKMTGITPSQYRDGRR